MNQIPCFYVFEKEIMDETFYKVYVDGERLCFAKIPYLEQNDSWMWFFSSDSFLFLIGVLIDLLGLPQKKWERKLKKRQEIERQYDDWSRNQMETLLACDGNFAMSLTDLKKVELIPTADYIDNRGTLRLFFKEGEVRIFTFHKTYLNRIHTLLQEAVPTLAIERKKW